MTAPASSPRSILGAALVAPATVAMPPMPPPALSATEQGHAAIPPAPPQLPAFPKPIGAIDAEWNREFGRLFALADVTKAERRLLQHIANEADLLNLPGLQAGPGPLWLVVPVSAAMLDLLAAFESDVIEADDCGREPDADGEPDDEGDEHEDREHWWHQLPNPAPAWHGRLKPERQVRRG